MKGVSRRASPETNWSECLRRDGHWRGMIRKILTVPISRRIGFQVFDAARKYNVGVVPNVFRNMEINALGVL